MEENNMLTEQQKQEVLIKNYDKINKDNIPIKKLRFPMCEGVHQKITLISNESGRFKNIAFVKDIENTINGNIADDLLDLFPQFFSVIKQNGVLVSKGKSNKMQDTIRNEVIAELKNNFKLIPIEKKPTKRTEPNKKGIDSPQVKESKVTNKYQKVE